MPKQSFSNPLTRFFLQSLQRRGAATLISMIQKEIEKTEKTNDSLRLRVLNSNLEVDLLKVKKLALEKAIRFIESQTPNTKKKGGGI